MKELMDVSQSFRKNWTLIVCWYTSHSKTTLINFIQRESGDRGDTTKTILKFTLKFIIICIIFSG